MQQYLIGCKGTKNIRNNIILCIFEYIKTLIYVYTYTNTQRYMYIYNNVFKIICVHINIETRPQTYIDNQVLIIIVAYYLSF